MEKVAKFNDNQREQEWTVRIVEEGDKYGLDNCLTYQKDEPVIEFYDAEHDFHKLEDGTILGQFVGRYYLSTIMEGTGGLNLMGYEPKWTIEDFAMDTIREYIQKYADKVGWSWEADGLFNHKFFKDGVQYS